MESFDEIRHLLLRREQEHLRRIDDRLDDQDRRTREVAEVLPQAVTRSREARGQALDRALQPALEGSIRESIQRRPEIFIEAFQPIIGVIIRRAIAESMRGLLQSMNEAMEHTFSWQGMKWRMEARRTGRSFAEVVMLRSLVYRVEQIFLIHRETSLALLQVTADSVGAKDSDMVAGMLSAIQDFARDSFETGVDSALEEFRVGELQVWIAPGPHAYLAAVIRGNPSRELRVALEETVENVHVLRGAELANFDGDPAAFEPLRPDLERCLRARYRQESAAPGKVNRAQLALANLGIVLLVLALLAWRGWSRWGDFLHRLGNEPGIALTAAEHRWLGPSRVSGLRDPLAADPVPLARGAGVNPKHVRFDWKPYLALDPVSVRRRFEGRFGLPADTRVTVREGGTVEVAGAAPYEWLERVRHEAAQVPGIGALTEREVRVAHDPALVRARFATAYPIPAGVNVQVEGSTLVLSGRAPSAWLVPVRAGAAHLPGIDAVAERDLAVTFAPASVRRQFEERFGLPEGVTASGNEDGSVTLAGEAPHAWLARVRQGAAAGAAGVGAVDDRGVTDRDQQTFQQAKSAIEGASVYFLPNKESVAIEGFGVLSRLPDEILRLLTAAKHLDQPVAIEVHGSADNTGPEAKNRDLSERRAGTVRDFLVSSGLDATLFRSLGLGTSPAGGEKRAAEATQRRVAFRVVLPTISPRP